MRIEIIDDNNFIAYIIKEYISYDNDLEEYIKKVFCKLNDLYDLDTDNGYFYVTLYKDLNYGTVMEINKTAIDYYSYNINLEIEEYDTNFYIETDEIEKNNIFYNNKIYKKIDNRINDCNNILYTNIDKAKIIDI